MDRISGSDVDPDANGAGVRGFRDGTPGINAGTEITAAWLNSVQEEICNAVIQGGLTLSPLSRTQLRDAIEAMIASQLASAHGYTPFTSAEYEWSGLHAFGAGLLVSAAAFTGAVSFGGTVTLNGPVITNDPVTVNEPATFNANIVLGSGVNVTASPTRGFTRLLDMTSMRETGAADTWQITSTGEAACSTGTTNYAIFPLKGVVPNSGNVIAFRIATNGWVNFEIEFGYFQRATGGGSSVFTRYHSIAETQPVAGDLVVTQAAFGGFVQGPADAMRERVFRVRRISGTALIRWIEVTANVANLTDV